MENLSVGYAKIDLRSNIMKQSFDKTNPIESGMNEEIIYLDRKNL
jgi:hypothetical protein